MDEDEMEEIKRIYLEHFRIRFGEQLDDAEQKWRKDWWYTPIGLIILTLSVALFIYNFVNQNFLLSAFNWLSSAMLTWSFLGYMKSRIELLKAITELREEIKSKN